MAQFDPCFALLQALVGNKDSPCPVIMARRRIATPALPEWIGRSLPSSSTRRTDRPLLSARINFDGYHTHARLE
jgi:hypothetical protein